MQLCSSTIFFSLGRYTVEVLLWCRLSAISPVKSLGTGGNNQCGSVLNSAGCRYSAGVSGWHIPVVRETNLCMVVHLIPSGDFSFSMLI